MCKYRPKGPFYIRFSGDLEEVDLEFLPGQAFLRDFIKQRFGKDPASRMYFCSDCAKELWDHYYERMR